MVAHACAHEVGEGWRIGVSPLKFSIKVADTSQTRGGESRELRIDSRARQQPVSGCFLEAIELPRLLTTTMLLMMLPKETIGTSLNLPCAGERSP